MPGYNTSALMNNDSAHQDDYHLNRREIFYAKKHKVETGLYTRLSREDSSIRLSLSRSIESSSAP